MNTLKELIQAGDTSALEALFAEQPLLITKTLDQGVSPIQFAAYCRQKDVVNLFMNHLTKLSAFEASSLGELEELKRRIAEQPDIIHQTAPDGFTCLSLAAFFGQEQVVDYLLAQGADPNQAAANSFQIAPLHAAAAISNLTISKSLLQAGAYPNAVQQQGVTPLHSAAHNGAKELCELLIYHGANPNAVLDSGELPAHLARQAGYGELAVWLEAQ